MLHAARFDKDCINLLRACVYIIAENYIIVHRKHKDNMLKL